MHSLRAFTRSESLLYLLSRVLASFSAALAALTSRVFIDLRAYSIKS